AIGQLYPGDTHFQEALVLEEVQVPVTLGDGVVNRMLALHASQREAAAGDEVHPDGERLGRQIEVRARHLPRRRDPPRQPQTTCQSYPIPYLLRSSLPTRN